MSQDLETKAAAQHAVWGHWMRYQFSVCLNTIDGDGSLIIPGELVKRWKRQMDTGYYDLSEDEKQSDRDIVRKFDL